MLVFKTGVLFVACFLVSRAVSVCVKRVDVVQEGCKKVGEDCGVSISELIRANPDRLTVERCESQDFTLNGTVCCERHSRQSSAGRGLGSGSGMPDVCNKATDGSRFTVGTSISLQAAVDANDCLSKCSSEPTCAFFDFHKQSRTCQLLSSVAATELEAGWAFGCV